MEWGTGPYSAITGGARPFVTRYCHDIAKAGIIDIPAVGGRE
jgi:hypothetical protein